MKKPRFQVEMTEDQNRLLDELIADAGLTGKRDLFNSALSLFFWAVERSKEGRAIASISPDGKSLRELEMPSLLALREAARRKIKAEGEQLFAELTDIEAAAKGRLLAEEEVFSQEAMDKQLAQLEELFIRFEELSDKTKTFKHRGLLEEESAKLKSLVEEVEKKLAEAESEVMSQRIKEAARTAEKTSKFGAA